MGFLVEPRSLPNPTHVSDEFDGMFPGNTASCNVKLRTMSAIGSSKWQSWSIQASVRDLVGLGPSLGLLSARLAFITTALQVPPLFRSRELMRPHHHIIVMLYATMIKGPITNVYVEWSGTPPLFSNPTAAPNSNL